MLGVASRSGPITWQVPNAANLVLRQLGILMFLGAAGMGSGATFAAAIVTRHGLALLGAACVLAAAFAAAVPLVVQVALRRDVYETAGMLAGMETQPAALAYAGERTGWRRAGQRGVRAGVPRRHDRQDRRGAAAGVSGC